MAVNSFVLALNQAILPEEMEWPVHDIRLELMERALREKKPNWAIRLFQNLGLPPEDHPAYLPTLRAAALGYARLVSWIEQRPWQRRFCTPEARLSIPS